MQAPPGPSRRAAYDKRRTAEQPWRRWYWTPRWRALAKAQIAAEPLCARCLTRGVYEPATVCHHVEPHRGDLEKFWSGPFASSCKPCHDIDEQRIENGGRARQAVGADGWPIEEATP